MTRAPILAIDTSGSFCSVAIRVADGVVHDRVSGGAGDHFEQLPNLVRAVCEDARISLSELREIRIGVGPGSFTGLRIGMSYAKGVAMAVQAPLVGVSSFYGVAVAAMAGTTSCPKRIMVVSDARRDEVFLGQFEMQKGGVVGIGAESIETVPRLRDLVAQNPGSLVLSPLKGFAVDGISVVEEPRSAVGIVAAGAPEASFSVEGVALSEPNYLRSVSAKTIEERRGG